MVNWHIYSNSNKN